MSSYNFSQKSFPTYKNTDILDERGHILILVNYLLSYFTGISTFICTAICVILLITNSSSGPLLIFGTVTLCCCLSLLYNLYNIHYFDYYLKYI
jgi:hypothetical protein